MKKNLWSAAKTIIGLAGLLFYIYPIILILISCVKSKKEMALNPFGFPKVINFENITKAFGRMNYWQTLLNTVIITVAVVGLTLLISSMAAYAISRKGKKYSWLYYLFLSGLLVPFQMIMIPLYKLVMNLHMINSIPGIIAVYLATQCPMAIFLLTGFVKLVPCEVEEAAYIDGAGIFRTFFTIVLPMMRNSLVTVALLTAFRVWNDFLMPMLFLQERTKLTLTVMLSNFQGQYFNDWSMMFAGVALIALPMIVVYLVAQKYIINGITAGSVKG